MSTLPSLIMGIDASNLLLGGGRTHLLELLSHTNPKDHGFSKVIVWGAKTTLVLLPDIDWLIKRNPSALDGGLVQRLFWQLFQLDKQVHAEGCHILFTPGGTYGGRFKPIVTMNQNLIPFEWRVLKRYGLSFTSMKMLMLRWTQSHSFRTADGVIFLSKYAEIEVKKVVSPLLGRTQIIPHGQNIGFNRPPKPQKAIRNYNTSQPYRLLYVSTVDQYKHQWQVVAAVGSFR